MWRGHRTALADRLRVVTPDLPGFGQVSGPFTMADAS